MKTIKRDIDELQDEDTIKDTEKKEEKYYVEWRSMIKRFMRVKTAVVGLFILSIYVFFSIFGNFIMPHPITETNLEARLQPPSSNYFFGTDWLGRDLLSLFIFASRTSIIVAFVTVIFAVGGGLVVGLVSGYYGGMIDEVIMRACDILLAFPYIILAIVILSLTGTSLLNVCLVLAIGRIPRVARILRSTVMSIKSRDYILASKALGFSDIHIMFRNILPNAIGPMTIVIAMGAALAVIQEATLSFLGIGVPPPAIGFGYITSIGRKYFLLKPHITLIPALGVAFLALSFSLIADGLRDSLDPRLR
jgi:peptide/nickel transport system permease protein